MMLTVEQLSAMTPIRRIPGIVFVLVRSDLVCFVSLTPWHVNRETEY